MPDYEIKEWNETNFDLNAIPWTKEAGIIVKWSLASDYIRHYAIFKYGGIYMENVWIISAVVTTFIRMVPMRRILSILE